MNYLRSTFLRRIQILRHLSDYEVAKIAHVADREIYERNQYIVRQGAEGDTFYIIVKGKCNVYVLDEATNSQKFVRELSSGSHFGEKALKTKNRERIGFFIFRPFVFTFIFLNSLTDVFKIYILFMKNS